jgi:hypothetical protein
MTMVIGHQRQWSGLALAKSSPQSWALKTLGTLSLRKNCEGILTKTINKK